MYLRKQALNLFRSAATSGSCLTFAFQPEAARLQLHTLKMNEWMAETDVFPPRSLPLTF